MPLDRPLILDACSLINLLASGRAGAMIRALPTPTLVTETVRALELRADETALLDALNPQGDQLHDLLGTGDLSVVDFIEDPIDEVALFLDFAAALGDDGEAASLAVASVRGYAVATDDRRARAFASREVASVPLVYTLEIVQQWEITTGALRTELGQALFLIQTEGNYAPSHSHPLFSWWEASMTS